MHYDVYGVGNALVDIVTEVGPEFFSAHGIERGVMTLVDDDRQRMLVKAIQSKESKMSCGGSAANTLISVAQFGGQAFYSCLVAHDELGRFFLSDLVRNKVDTALTYDECPSGDTGRCLVMTSPDADRTLNTFLGITSSLSPAQLSAPAIRASSYVYLEGYLVAATSGFETLLRAKKIAEEAGVRTAFTLSDPSMVRYFQNQINDVIGASVDLLFCNEEEAFLFTGASSLQGASEKLRKSARKFAITLGANGALVFDGDVFIDIEPYRVKAVDTNGAGDMFAGAFLYAITHGNSFADAGKLASLASSRVVSQFGPRLTPEQAKRVLADLIA